MVPERTTSGDVWSAVPERRSSGRHTETGERLTITRAEIGLRMLWLASDAGLLRPDPRPEEADPLAPGSILTTLLRFPPGPALVLAGQGRELLAIDPGQYAYPPESLHVTLADATGLDPAGAAADLRSLAPALHGCRGRIVGFGLSRRTAFAALMVDPALGDARGRLRAQWARSGPAALPERLLSRMWYANFLRLVHQPAPELIHRLRQLPVVTEPFAFPRVELVRTNKVMAAGRTAGLAAFDLV